MKRKCMRVVSSTVGMSIVMDSEAGRNIRFLLKERNHAVQTEFKGIQDFQRNA